MVELQVQLGTINFQLKFLKHFKSSRVLTKIIIYQLLIKQLNILMLLLWVWRILGKRICNLSIVVNLNWIFSCSVEFVNFFFFWVLFGSVHGSLGAEP